MKGREQEQQEKSTPSDFRKWLTISTAYIVCFAVGINVTAVLSVVAEVTSHFDVNDTSFSYSYFPVTAWNLAAAMFPLSILPLIKDVGIRPTYLTMYVLFVIVQAVARNFTIVIVACVTSAACGGDLQNLVGGIKADLWQDHKRKRTTSLTMYTFSLVRGVTFGPVFGRAVIKYLYWRW
jgi:predicted MFS family arabinose efflux permease